MPSVPQRLQAPSQQVRMVSSRQVPPLGSLSGMLQHGHLRSPHCALRHRMACTPPVAVRRSAAEVHESICTHAPISAQAYSTMACTSTSLNLHGLGEAVWTSADVGLTVHV